MRQQLKAQGAEGLDEIMVMFPKNDAGVLFMVKKNAEAIAKEM